MIDVVFQLGDYLINSIAFQPFPRCGKAHGRTATSLEMVYAGFTFRIIAGFLSSSSLFFLNSCTGGSIRALAPGYGLQHITVFLHENIVPTFLRAEKYEVIFFGTLFGMDIKTMNNKCLVKIQHNVFYRKKHTNPGSTIVVNCPCSNDTGLYFCPRLSLIKV